MSALTKGEKWIRMLRGYAPVAENKAQQAEHVDDHSAKFDVPPIRFDHPAKPLVLESFPLDSGCFKNTVLTGTAGDGKTSLCFELIWDLAQRKPKKDEGVDTLQVETVAGIRPVTFVFDVTAWRRSVPIQTVIDLLERMAASIAAQSEEYFVLAVNDGQMHELFRSLKDTVTPAVRALADDLIRMHATGAISFGERLRMINLSVTVPSDELMRRCLTAILDRPEWRCFSEESDSPLFHAASSLRRNYDALKSSKARERLVTLARVADATSHHLPIRGILCLLTNALLGHPDAQDGVVRPGKEAGEIMKGNTSHKAALHRNLFGGNLTRSKRSKREIYRFLSMLQIGEETTNDLDELIIFGSRDEELTPDYNSFVAVDPHRQRSLSLDGHIDSYIRGDIATEEKTNEFLTELGHERRRLFLYASDEEMEKFALWHTSVFHHAGDYLEHILKPLSEGRGVSRHYLRRIVCGLNRIWTGLLLAENPHELYLATGLDLTTSPVSDILMETTALDSDPPGFEITASAGCETPKAVITSKDKEFSFHLTLPRFEFLSRVADGAMPSSFSRECCSDFMSLKPRCMRKIGIKSNARVMYLIEVHTSGTIQRQAIHLL